MRIFWGVVLVFSGTMFALTACHVVPQSGWDLEIACGYTAVSLFLSGLGKLIGVEE